MAKKGRTQSLNGSAPTDAMVRRLDVIIRLLLDWVPSADAPSRSAYDASLLLAKAGLSPTEIASITGRHRNNVSRDLSKARTKRRRKAHRL
jgi:DNA-directed RNA polymerase specialized sigma24 family protein